MFLVEKLISAIFVAEDCSPLSLQKTGAKYMKEEIENTYCSFKVKEISKVSEVPEDWHGSLIYGIKEEMDPSEYILKYGDDNQYKEFMRLKAIYEPEEKAKV